ncbi:hypothetical protein [Sinorhizobium medicae]|uniref:hypothetical protein n=1 Tax=Sinorhizobium medicae TaxID=110321 RepID=UPI000FD70FA3|nr:hypothetical protein [Sinorhizobium medicae]MQX46581.1 hypothetical protein [Sinorhizobium medicae]RVI55197.1 hypothetical protein CN192_15760 [Sinorhizobium medicae]
MVTISEANRDVGRDKEAEGLEIYTNAMLGRRCDRPLPEMPVPLKLDALAVDALYPGDDSGHLP